MARGDFQPDAAGQGAPPDCGQAPGWANFYRVTFMPSSRKKSKPESNLRISYVTDNGEEKIIDEYGVLYLGDLFKKN